MAEKEYIEREAAKKKHCEICMEECICYRSKSTCDELKAFDLIPAADVRPVVRGKWIKTKEQEGKMFTRIIWKCSVCGIEVINTEPVYRINDWYFCPNCGADMREGE